LHKKKMSKSKKLPKKKLWKQFSRGRWRFRYNDERKRKRIRFRI